MNVICSPKGIVDLLRPGQGISDIVNAGFGSVCLDMSMGYSDEELEKFSTEYSKEIRTCFQAMLAECQEKQLEISIARMP